MVEKGFLTLLTFTLNDYALKRDCKPSRALNITMIIMILFGSEVLQNIPKLNSNFQKSTEKLLGLIIHWLYSCA